MVQSIKGLERGDGSTPLKHTLLEWGAEIKRRTRKNGD